MIYFTKTANHFDEKDKERITIETESVDIQEIKETFYKFLLSANMYEVKEGDITPEKVKRSTEDFWI